MVHFVMNDLEHLQRSSDGLRFICVIIIMIFLLHVHMLKIMQLICCVRLGLDCMDIMKVLQCLAFGTPSKLVTVYFCNVVV